MKVKSNVILEWTYMAETATDIFVIAAVATSGHHDFATENEIPIGPAVTLSVYYCIIEPSKR